jgi:phenylalanyl-tRNA synthetase beta chain
MNISYNWLKEFINISLSPEETSKLLTSIGLEVEAVEKFESIKGGLEGFVIAEVISCEKHPNADKLSKTTVDIGNGQIVPIVCGAPNVAKGQKVVVATVGTTCYSTQGEPFAIKKAKIRDEVSEGMICAEDEMGLGNSHEGIMVLNTQLPNGTPAAKFFNIENDFIFVIGLTPNRADAASHLGVARDLFAAVNEQLNQAITLKKPDISSFISTQLKPLEVIVENSESCPRYAGVVIENIVVSSSPTWLQNRLKSIGLTPINNVVDITNFVLHELGQPLHAFDLKKVTGNKIIVKNAAKDTIFTTLDGKQRKLNTTDLTISNAEAPMCLAGIFGGLDSGVTHQTKSIFLESAYFSPQSIRKTSQLHGLKTDASFRFERGIDPNITIYALKRAALLIEELCGGKVASDVYDFYPQKIDNYKFNVSYKNINRLIGLSIAPQKIFSILDALEINISNETTEAFEVSVPPYRVDVQREADIIEEIIRIYGFENITMKSHIGSDYLADFPVLTKEKFTNSLAFLLVGKGFNEIMTNSLTKQEYSDILGKTDSKVEILNKLSPELSILRQSMVFSGLEAISYNINRKQKDLKFFEFGKTYQKTGQEGVQKDYKEFSTLAIFITGNQLSEIWNSKNKSVDFQDIKSIVSQVFWTLNISDYKLIPINSGEIFSQGISIEKNTKIIASFGLVKSNLGKYSDVKQPVYYAEFNMDLIFKMVSNKLEYNEIPKFPEVRRDLSLVIDKKVKFAEIETIAQKTERKILKAINVFDVYEGEKMEQGKKSYSVSFLLQDSEQTLTDKQIDNTMQRLIQAFEKELGAVIRV